MLPKDTNIDVSRETRDKLALYYDLLLKWQKKINLISGKEQDDVWVRHFQDSLQIIPLLPEDVKTLYDFGSGGGFPGMVVGLATDLRVVLVESDSRKCSFLKTVSRETQSANVATLNSRIENISLDVPTVITARALASLNVLLAYAWNLWGADCRNVSFIFLKGKNWEVEIEEAKADFCFDCKTFQSQTSQEAKIIKITALRCV